MNRSLHFAFILLLGLTACGSGPKTDADFRAEIVARMHELVLTDVQALHQSALDVQAAAPLPDGRGWDASADQAAIDRMKSGWGRMRTAWEGAEGVLAPRFPDLDGTLDPRYDESLATLAPTGDPNLFDGQGIIGMHALERIIYAPDIPPDVTAQESLLPGSSPAVWPATSAEARTLEMGLCARLVSDSQRLVDSWMPQAIELPQAFEGLTSLMSAQAEKISLVASHEQESRYSQRTLGDMRDNLAGTRAIYALFVPWLETKPDAAAIHAAVQTAFQRLDDTYSTVAGDAIPAPPPTWSSTAPSVADQQSAFGRLYLAVVQEVDPTRAGSAVDAMNHVARALGLPELMAARLRPDLQRLRSTTAARSSGSCTAAWPGPCSPRRCCIWCSRAVGPG